MTTVAIIAFLLYHVGAGMKRGWWEHLGQYVETGCVFVLAWLVLDIWLAIALSLAGNVLFQGFTNLSFKRAFIDRTERWSWDLRLGCVTLWIPKLPHYWRLLQLPVALAITLWRLT